MSDESWIGKTSWGDEVVEEQVYRQETIRLTKDKRGRWGWIVGSIQRMASNRHRNPTLSSAKNEVDSYVDKK